MKVNPMQPKGSSTTNRQTEKRSDERGGQRSLDQQKKGRTVSKITPMKQWRTDRWGSKTIPKNDAGTDPEQKAGQDFTILWYDREY